MVALAGFFSDIDPVAYVRFIAFIETDFVSFNAHDFNGFVGVIVAAQEIIESRLQGAVVLFHPAVFRQHKVSDGSQS
jgi:hypothetical protein